MRVKRLSFNQLVFICLGFQYLLMRLFSAGEAIVITSIELVIYIVYTVATLAGLFLRSRRIDSEAVSGLSSLFFSVLWTVSLFSQFRKESYPNALTIINSLGVSSAVIVMLTQFIILAKAQALAEKGGCPVAILWLLRHSFVFFIPRNESSPCSFRLNSNSLSCLV